MSKLKDDNDEVFLHNCLHSKNITEVSKLYECTSTSVKNRLIKMGIDYSGNQSGKGLKKKFPKMTLAEYLENSADIQTNKIRKKILEEGIKEHECECCGLTEWMGKPIPLEVHHKDGDRSHNELSNFELLCPNCHAFTDSYRGKNSRKE